MSEAIISNIKETINDALRYCDSIISKTADNNLDSHSIITLVNSIELLSNSVIYFQDVIDNINELNEVLNNLVNSLEDNNLFLFSDLTEYELKPLLENWLININ